MTVEAKFKILGMPVWTQELFPLDDEPRFIFFDDNKMYDSSSEDFLMRGMSVLSENEIAVYRFDPTEESDIYRRGEPTYLAYDKINEANLKLLDHLPLVTKEIHWRPTR